MKATHSSMSGSFQRRAAVLGFGAILAACSSAGGGSQPGQSVASSTTGADLTSFDTKDPRVLDWQKAIKKVRSTKVGCFESRYPSTTWTEVECGAPPKVPATSRGPVATSAPELGSQTGAAPTGSTKLDEARGPSLGPFGGGSTTGDYFATASGPIYEATGTFLHVAGDTTNSGFSIQLNSNGFTVPAGNAICPGCSGWQQGVLSTSQGAFMEDWIFNQSSCNILGGWIPSNGGCFFNSPHIQNLPSLSLTQLQGVSMEMFVSTSDTLTVTIGGTSYRVTEASVLGLGQNRWTSSQFGVYGDGNFSGLNLSSGTSIQYALDSEAPNTVACASSAVNGGATGETNNLSQACCLNNAGGQPGIAYEESNNTPATCDLCGAIGQACCSLPAPGCRGPWTTCYSQTCEACGGHGQQCCPGNNPCQSGADYCQGGSCGLPDELTVSPTAISLSPGDGAALSVNYASTHATLTGAWASSTIAPTFGDWYGVPANVTCSGNGIAPVSGPSTITCTANVNATPGTSSVVTVSATIGGVTQYTTFTLNVGTCVPDSCSHIGYACGTLDTGCGYEDSCGSCPSGDTCTAGACYKCAERYCPPPQFFNLNTCECQGCPCGEFHVNGHYICAVCRP